MDFNEIVWDRLYSKSNINVNDDLAENQRGRPPAGLRPVTQQTVGHMWLLQPQAETAGPGTWSPVWAARPFMIRKSAAAGTALLRAAPFLKLTLRRIGAGAVLL